MKNKLRGHFHRYMVRPLIYQVFTRCVITLTVILLYNELTGRENSLSWAFLIAAFLYGALAWMAFLRLDGIRTPTFDRKLFRRRRRNNFGYGDIADHIEDDPVSFEELDDGEKDLCLLLCDCIVAVMLAIPGAIL